VLINGTSTEWLDKLTKADVPCAPVLTRSQVIRHPHVHALELIEEYDHPRPAGCARPAPPRGSPAPDSNPPRRAGARRATEEVLANSLLCRRDRCAHGRRCVTQAAE